MRSEMSPKYFCFADAKGNPVKVPLDGKPKPFTEEEKKEFSEVVHKALKQMEYNFRRRNGESAMSSFGDGNVKTFMQEELDYIAKSYYGKKIYDMTPEEKVKFLGELFDVLRYLFEEW